MTKSVQMYFAPFADSLPSKSDLSLHASGAFLLKRCSKCKTEKPLNEFGESKTTKDGFYSQCRKCKAKYWKQYLRNHPSIYRKYLEKNKKWQRENINKQREFRRRAKHKILSTTKGSLDNRMGKSIWKMLRKNKSNRCWQSLVGYTTGDLKKHIESLFAEDMTWDLFLQGEIHIDHRVPKSFFIYDKPEDQEFQYCWSLDNLQPLWAGDNIKKSYKISTKEKIWEQKQII